MNLLKMLDGYKTYVVCSIGVIVAVVNHFWALPYVNLDQSNWLNDVWGNVLIMTGRSAVAKLQ